MLEVPFQNRYELGAIGKRLVQYAGEHRLLLQTAKALTIYGEVEESLLECL
jgi:hypothetical protein